MRPVLNLQRKKTMGFVYADILLVNGDDLTDLKRKRITEDEVKRLKVRVLVDSGAIMLAINEEIANQLDLVSPLDKRPAQMADGSVVLLDVVGPVEIRFGNRRTNVDAIVLPGNAQPLLGVIPMEDMDVLIDPKVNALIINPEHPYKPLVVLK
jgi:clan AA aspartic protease